MPKSRLTSMTPYTRCYNEGGFTRGFRCECPQGFEGNPTQQCVGEICLTWFVLRSELPSFCHTSWQCCGSGSRIVWLFDPWIQDPGWVESQHPDPRSRMNNPDHIFWSLETIFCFFWVKILKLFDEDPGSGIRDGDSSDPGSEMEKSRIRRICPAVSSGDCQFIYQCDLS
jgi:hypothetical protein